MNVLIVKSRTNGLDSPFIQEQMESCRKLGVSFDVLNITRGGAIGYTIAYLKLLGKALNGRYDLIHAHYGLAGFLAVLQPFKPVIVTFHGCDVNDKKTRWISKIAYRFSRQAIVVEESMIEKLNADQSIINIPCGVDTTIFRPMQKDLCRKTLGFPSESRIVLFGSSFDTPVKNSALAREVIASLKNVELIELKNKTREEVNLLLNSCDLLLLTSKREGSPMVIKEALSAGCPIVSTDVGDIRSRIEGVQNALVCPQDAPKLRAAVETILESDNRSNGRQRIFEQGLDLESISERIYTIYKKCAG